MSNKKLGNDFESEFCEYLSQQGFWAHNCQNRSGGQPADVIAVKGNEAVLVDCKVCSNLYFDTNRIEPNQRIAMQKWWDVTDYNGYFAIKFEETGEVFMYPWSMAKDAKGRVPYTEVVSVSLTLEQFCKLL